MTAAPTPLTVSSAPTTTNNNGFNAQGSSSTDRVLATSPTSISGSALELAFTNTTGAEINGLQARYDIRRYTAAGTANELPGYWLFYSLDNGATWANVSVLNPAISGSTGVVVPNTVGVTTVAGTTFSLSSPGHPAPSFFSGGLTTMRWRLLLIRSSVSTMSVSPRSSPVHPTKPSFSTASTSTSRWAPPHRHSARPVLPWRPGLSGPVQESRQAPARVA